MNIKAILACGTAAAMLAAGSANAAKVILHDVGGVTGSAAEKDFAIAAAYWGSTFTNNVTIQLDVGFNALPPNVIGSTGSARMNYLVSNWENRVNATKSNSTLDQTLVLPTLSGGGASLVTNGVDATGNNDTTSQVYSDADKYADYVLYMNTAVGKAIGANVSPNQIDGAVTFSSDFAFDFDPTDGISAGHMDFLGVAIHEIGHALGFVSGVDFFDEYGGPNGPGYGLLGYDLNDTSIFSALDMFRYSNDPHNLGPGGPVLDETVGTHSYFSIDGGHTALFGNSVSTGYYNGDGNQASHWKDAEGANVCGPQLGIMDPTFCYAQMGEVTGLDLAAFDAMGWNLSVDALADNGSYRATTGSIFASIGSNASHFVSYAPEPGTWALMIGGFGAVGVSMRRRTRASVSFG